MSNEMDKNRSSSPFANNRKRRVLVLTSTFPRWKNDNEPPFVYELCKRLKKEFDIHVLAPHFRGAEVSENLDGIGIRRFRYFISKGENLCYEGGILANIKQNKLLIGLIPFFFCSQLLATLSILKKYKFDIIHSHWLIPQGIIAVIACTVMKCPPKVLCTSHGGDLYGLRGFFLKWVKSIVIRKSDAITVVSNSMKKEAVKIYCKSSKIHTIPMGTDLVHTFVPSLKEDKNKQLLFVGRLVEKKGLRYLLDALPAVIKRFPDTLLHIVGDGPDRYALQKRAIYLGIENHVIFHGAVTHAELPSFYQKADIFVFPSIVGKDGDREGFGLVLVEAMGAECAVVSTDLEAMKDIVIDGKTGLVVPQKNCIQLTEKICFLIDNDRFRRKLSSNARNHVYQKFDWGIISRKYINIINTI